MPKLPKKVRPHQQYSKGAVGNFYSNSAWRKTRAYKLKLNPICEHCYKKGELKSAEMVDHIKPISEGGHAFDLDNLQSLCNHCHAIKTGKETAKRR